MNQILPNFNNEVILNSTNNPNGNSIKSKLEEIFVVFGTIFNEEKFFLQFKTNIFKLTTLVNDNSLPSFRNIRTLMDEFEKIMQTQEKDMILTITAFYYFLYKNFISIQDNNLVNASNPPTHKTIINNNFNNARNFQTMNPNFNPYNGQSFIPNFSNNNVNFSNNTAFINKKFPRNCRNTNKKYERMSQNEDSFFQNENKSPNKNKNFHSVEISSEIQALPFDDNFIGKKQHRKSSVKQGISQKQEDSREEGELIPHEDKAKTNYQIEEVEDNIKFENKNENAQKNDQEVLPEFKEKFKHSDDKKFTENENKIVQIDKNEIIDNDKIIPAEIEIDILDQKKINEKNNYLISNPEDDLLNNNENEIYLEFENIDTENNKISKFSESLEKNGLEITDNECRDNYQIHIDKEELSSHKEKNEVHDKSLSSSKKSEDDFSGKKAKKIKTSKNKELKNFDLKYDDLIKTSSGSNYIQIINEDSEIQIEILEEALFKIKNNIIVNPLIYILKIGEISNREEMEDFRKIIRSDYLIQYNKCFEHSLNENPGKYYFKTRIKNKFNNYYILKYDKGSYEFMIISINN